ncbi:Rieske (2Fe-2S) protein [Dactylosporangium sp. AC04546]|uniref:Rieske (2Fe-2S) protein n=1 Tax=Dactylosporangium sp. AC04546 TaxID=2862460 RepID=UPI0021076420|nr:Rieske (2Fe-2S) protein [Dactylosporangium sp. AC04546]WVK83683.1 Rieske (2Fe-2S) protein [Dactylosporangium sp. AC04546]
MTNQTTRRTLLAGTAAAGMTAALAGCAAYGDTGTNNGANPGPPADTGAAAGGTGTTDAGTGGGTGNGGGGGGGAGFAKTSDIPVGGGKVFENEKIVVTQPTAGTFKCFTAICTHAGCVVGDVSDGTINCPCHGSKFKVADGSVAGGPAKKALAAVAIKVDGDAIKKA